MMDRWMPLTLAVAICCGAASPTGASILRYEYEGTFSSGVLDGEIVSGYVDLDDTIVLPNDFTSAPPAPGLLTEGVVGWSYTTPLGTFDNTNSMAGIGQSHVYKISSVSPPSTNMSDWAVNLVWDNRLLRLLPTGMVLLSDSKDLPTQSAGTGSFTFAGEVPEPTSLAIWLLVASLAVFFNRRWHTRWAG